MTRAFVAAAVVCIVFPSLGRSATILPPVHHAAGAYRVLVVRATWEPEPFTTQAVQDAFAQADSFFRQSSFGAFWLNVTITPWVRAYDAEPACDLTALAGGATAAAKAAGYEPNAYDAVVFLHPPTSCPWSGVTVQPEIWLNGTISPRIIVHELGHSLGLGHANTTNCVSHFCNALAYGDPYDTMGQGIGDFGVYGKYTLGWVTNVAQARAVGSYTIAPLEHASSGAQGLVVTTAESQYWFDDRSKVAMSEGGERVADSGVLVHMNPSPDLRGSSVPILTNLLIVDPAGRGRPDLHPGDQTVDRGIFSVRVVRSDATAELRFEWLDRTAPRAPHVYVSGAGRGLRISWSPAHETGSGVAYYEVSIDARKPMRIAGAVDQFSVLMHPVGAGAHVVRVVAVDRAGNRSSVGARTVTIVR